jgi:ankyrin repeat protein
VDEVLQDLVDAVTDCDLAKLDKCLNEATDLDAIVNVTFEDGLTLLWLACQLGHRDVVDRLIAVGADVDGVAFGESTREHHSCATVFFSQRCTFVHSLLAMPAEYMRTSCDSAPCGY